MADKDDPFDPQRTIMKPRPGGRQTGEQPTDAPPNEPTRTFDGALALSGLLVLSSGRVRVDPVQQPAVTNVMSTIDVALNMADSEPAPIAPSIPMPHSPSLTASPQAALKPVAAEAEFLGVDAAAPPSSTKLRSDDPITIYDWHR